jgi:sRNA-binding protein
MSLINDALRRATNETPKRDPNELPSMQPNYRTARAGGPGFSIFLVCFVLAAALTLGAWVYWKRGMAAKAAQPVSAAERAAAANTNNNPIARAAATLGKVDALNKEGENAADNIQQSATAVAKTTATAPTAGSSASTPAPGGPKLQGIFYTANNASAIINGKSMKVGDEANGIKILEINKGSVRIQSGSEVRELTMK